MLLFLSLGLWGHAGSTTQSNELSEVHNLANSSDLQCMYCVWETVQPAVKHVGHKWSFSWFLLWWRGCNRKTTCHNPVVHHTGRALSIWDTPWRPYTKIFVACVVCVWCVPQGAKSFIQSRTNMFFNFSDTATVLILLLTTPWQPWLQIRLISPNINFS